MFWDLVWVCVPETFHRALWPGWVQGFQQRAEGASRKGGSFLPLPLLQLAPPLSAPCCLSWSTLSRAGLGLGEAV